MKNEKLRNGKWDRKQEILDSKLVTGNRKREKRCPLSIFPFLNFLISQFPLSPVSYPISRVIIIALLFLIFLSIPQASFAASLYLSPGSGAIAQGGTKSVQIRLGTGGESINAVAAYLYYPTDKLSVASISYGGSFSIAAENSYGGGNIRISRGSINGVVGDVNIATVVFRGIAPGGASVSFVGGSAATKTADSSNALGGSAGGTYTVGGVAPPATSNSSNPTIPKAQRATPTPVDITPPMLDKIIVSKVTTTSATIAWKTDKPANSIIAYGIEKGKYIINVVDNTLTTEHEISLENLPVPPGNKLYLQIQSEDAKNNIGVSTEQVVQLKGYSLTLNVVADNKPLANALVTLYSDVQTQTTNASGMVIFTNVSPGIHAVVVKANDTEKSSQITVTDQSTQTFTVQGPPPATNVSQNQQAKPKDASVLIYLLLGITGVIIIIVIFVVIKNKKSPPPNQPQIPEQPVYYQTLQQ